MTTSYHPGMLERILESVRSRLGDLEADLERLRSRALSAPPPRPLTPSLATPGLSVIAEVKRRSPSAGEISPDLDPGALAAEYARGGASAISVLTEPSHFSGSAADLEAVRSAVGLPVLRKDFILHSAQVWESRAMGADAVLLIVAALDQPQLRALLAEVRSAGMEALVEVHTRAEAERAVEAGATVVGVNNRDLATFRVDLGTAERLAAALPDGVVRVAESGMSSLGAARRMAQAGYHAILVGEAAVRSPRPAEFVSRLRSTA